MSKIEQLADLHSQRKSSLLDRLIRAIFGIWGDFDSWDDKDLVTARASRTIPHVDSALRESQREARRFQLSVLRELGVPRPELALPVQIYPRAHVDSLEVYTRPARDAARKLAAGGDPAEVRAAFERRVRGIVEADIAAAERDEIERIQDALEAEGTADPDPDEPLHDGSDPSELMSSEEMEEIYGIPNEPALPELDQPTSTDKKKPNRVLGYRRVFRPELSKSGVCGLCVVAATQWYSRRNLKAIHHDCNCITLPITQAGDPGLQMNKADMRQALDEIYKVGGGTSGEKLKRLRVEVREHGELGSILTYYRKGGWKKQGLVPKPYVKPTVDLEMERLRRRKAALERTVRSLSSRAGTMHDPEEIASAIKEAKASLREVNSRLAA